MAKEKKAVDAPETNQNASGDKVAALIAMRRDEPLFDDGPITADVHPDEARNWLDAGWRVESTLDGVSIEKVTDGNAAAADDASTASVVEGDATAGSASPSADGQ